MFNPLEMVIESQLIMKINLPEKVPYLPGHSFSDPFKLNHHKTQQFQLQNNTQLEKTKFLTQPFDPNLTDSLYRGQTLNYVSQCRIKPTNDYIPRVQPPWLKYDRKVLRYNAYFQEHVVQSPIENYRIRKCLIYYYLSDSTIHVTQPPTQNSGITQGIFVKRMRIPVHIDHPQPYFRWYNLKLGENVKFFQRSFRIYDCDEFTKEFFKYMEQPIGTPQPEPKDNFEKFHQKKNLKINPPDTKDYKEYFQVKAGGGHPNGGLDMYLKNDRQVLSFRAVWNDTTLQGGLMYYVVNFFLADETVEVKQIKTLNSGKDPFPLLLRRMKLPKQPVLTHYPGMTLKKQQYYKPQDFLCRNYVMIFKRNCLIYDCDDFTKEWYRSRGIQQQPLQIQEELKREVERIIPPYNGYGTEEDSLGSIYYLEPKPPKKDMIKMFTCDQYVLRFEARLISTVRDDANKKFIINFYCGDDTISVFQPNERNSGIWGGKFLERMKHKKTDSESYLNEIDFQIGSVVKLGAYDFQLIRADEFTSGYMSSNPGKFPQSDLLKVIQKVKIGAKGHKDYNSFLIEVIKKLDSKKTGFTNFDLLKNSLREFGVDLSWQECHRLARQCNIGKDWRIEMAKLWNVLGGK